RSCCWRVRALVVAAEPGLWADLELPAGDPRRAPGLLCPGCFRWGEPDPGAGGLPLFPPRRAQFCGRHLTYCCRSQLCTRCKAASGKSRGESSMEKGLVFTYALMAVGVVGSLFRPFIGLLVYICFAIVRPEFMWPWSLPSQGHFSRTVGVAMLA